jgi:protein tyrosine phosphatase
LKAPESRTLIHFQYFNWPEKGVPNINNELIAFFEEISLMHQQSIDNFNKKRKRMYEPNPLGCPIREVVELPICVSCSTGCDNSATFCAINISLSHYHSRQLSRIAKIVEKIRERRSNAISSFEQYLFIYDFLVSYDKYVQGILKK